MKLTALLLLSLTVQAQMLLWTGEKTYDLYEEGTRVMMYQRGEKPYGGEFFIESTQVHRKYTQYSGYWNTGVISHRVDLYVPTQKSNPIKILIIDGAVMGCNRPQYNVDQIRNLLYKMQVPKERKRFKTKTIRK